jgi:hypothetical protein
MPNFLVEETLGVASLILTTAGMLLGQLDPSLGGAFVSVVTQFGGLGLAVWLVFHHTTKTIPDMQKEHRAEREASITQFAKELERKGHEHSIALRELTDEYREELVANREEFKSAVEKLATTVQKLSDTVEHKIIVKTQDIPR